MSFPMTTSWRFYVIRIIPVNYLLIRASFKGESLNDFLGLQIGF